MQTSDTVLPPLEQLATAWRQTAEAVEAMRAELAGVRSGVEALWNHLEQTQAVQQRTADHVERLRAEIERLKVVDALGAQIEALREAHVRTDGRIQQVATEAGRVARAETALAQLRHEVTEQLDARERALRSELAGHDKQRIEDQRQIGRELQGLLARLDSVERLPAAITAVDHRLGEATQDLHRVHARLDEAAAAGVKQQEASRRAEQQVLIAVAAQDARLTELAAEVDAWRARIDAQNEVVRAARGVADEMREAAGHIERSQHAAAEATRLAEGRLDVTLDVLRQEIEARWARFLTERQRQWDALARATDERESALQAELAADRGSATARDDELQETIEAGFEAAGRDLAALHHLMGAFVRRWREAADELSATIGPGLPSGDPAAVSAERRQALRRALRARRGG